MFGAFKVSDDWCMSENKCILKEVTFKVLARTDLLCHHIDFDSKHPTLFFGRCSLQAKVPTCKLHGEFHFDLMMNKYHRQFNNPSHKSHFPYCLHSDKLLIPLQHLTYLNRYSNYIVLLFSFLCAVLYTQGLNT